jgi:hypothetical protein
MTAFTRVTDLVDDIVAEQLNQYAKTLEGDSGSGRVISLTALNDAASYALSVANQDTTNGRALQVFKADLINKWLEITKTGVLLDGLEAVIVTTPASTAAAGRAALYPKASGWFSRLGIGAEFQLADLSGALAGYGLVGNGAGAAVWDPTQRKNRLRNGSFPIAQLGTSPTTTDNGYTLDGWRALLEAGSAATVSQQATGIVGAAITGCKLAIGASNNNKCGIWQPLESSDVYDLRGQTASLQLKMFTTDAQIGRASCTVVQWTGAGDSVASDPISTWNAAGTNPTLIASYAYANTPANLNPTTADATYRIPNIPISSSAVNLAVFIWIDDKTTTTGDALFITDVQLEKGAVCTDVERRHLSHEESLCKRWTRVFGGGDVSEVIGVAHCISTTVAACPIALDPEMRVAPTLRVSAAGDWVVAGVTPTSIAASTSTVRNVQAVATVAAGLTAGQAARLQANSTTNARLILEAGL